MLGAFSQQLGQESQQSLSVFNVAFITTKMFAQNVALRSKNIMGQNPRLFYMKRDMNLNFDLIILMADEKKKMKSNTEDDYNKALASDDPTKISKDEQEKLTREAVKKFKSLS
jgi:hypothetical protein